MQLSLQHQENALHIFKQLYRRRRLESSYCLPAVALAVPVGWGRRPLYLRGVDLRRAILHFLRPVLFLNASLRIPKLP